MKRGTEGGGGGTEDGEARREEKCLLIHLIQCEVGNKFGSSQAASNLFQRTFRSTLQKSKSKYPMSL